jgi:hypothetical protein
MNLLPSPSVGKQEHWMPAGSLTGSVKQRIVGVFSLTARRPKRKPEVHPAVGPGPQRRCHCRRSGDASPELSISDSCSPFTLEVSGMGRELERARTGE